MLFLVASAVLAAAAPSASLTLSVTDDRGRALDRAAVHADGPDHAAAVTGADGRIVFTHLGRGRYVLTAERAGYETSRREVDVAGTPVQAALELAPASMSTLREITRVSAVAGSGVPANSGTATTSVITGAELMERDPRRLVESLDELPGVVSTTNSGVGANRASAGAPMVTQIRGALAYETQSLIDGHPVSVGADGTFSPLLVKPAFLQAVEVAKGPGATSLEQSAAIGGTVNYRTLEPTRTRHAEAWLGIDGWGGPSAAFRATGTSGRFGYAVAATNDGTTGPLDNYRVAGSALPLLYAAPPYTVNGRPIAGAPIGLGPNPAQPHYAGAPGAVRYAEPVYVCCGRIDTGYDSRGGLLKVQYEPDERSALTLSYLTAQGDTDLSGARAQNETPVFDFAVFAPPSGYAGSLPAGTPISFDAVANVGLHESDRQQLLEAAYRTTLGPVALAARAYDSRASSFLYDTPGSHPFAFSGTAWGGLLTCPQGTRVVAGACAGAGGTSAPSPTFFNGTPAIFQASSPGTQALTSDFVHGYSLQLQRMAGAASLEVGLDRSTHESQQYVDSPTIPLQGYSLAPGSAQQTTTFLTRAELPYAGERGDLVLANYLIAYESHFSGDGGITWSDASHAVDAPRIALRWEATPATALRVAAGVSVAPPYINLLSSIGTQPIANTNGSATAYVQNANNGRVRPETAAGFEAGVDQRFGPRFVASLSAYLTNLRDLFLQSTHQQGTYTPPSGPNAGNTEPLYVTKTDNLGHARYEGIELSVTNDPLAGFGFVLNASVQRAFPYALPPGFYATAAGPLTTNLGVIPNVNFQPNGPGYNGLSGRIPYSQGYAALTWRSHQGARARLGVDYVGPNNPYNRPAFGILSAGVTLPLQGGTTLDVEGWNLAGAYDAPYENALSGVAVPLVNGQLGATDAGNVGPPSVSVTLHYVL